MKETTISYINFILSKIESDSSAEDREKRCDMVEGAVLMALTLDLINMDEMLSYCSRIQKLRGEAPATEEVVKKSGECHCGYCADRELIMNNTVCYIPTDDGGSVDIPVNFCPNCGDRLYE